MRLLKYVAQDEFELVEFPGRSAPQYAILSHTWGPDHEEVTFRDLNNGVGKGKKGYQKLVFCAKQAIKHDLQYFWVDTCCIDKSSSTELAEAINSMFRWYQSATRCFALLTDILVDPKTVTATTLQQVWETDIRHSKWFTRGWTLQELLAPTQVDFYSKEGIWLGDKTSRVRELSEMTRVADAALQKTPLSSYSVEERMSWANGRQTKREEDEAYSLLGIFDVYIPLIYGEGRWKAQIRLRKAILEAREDEKYLSLPYRQSDQARQNFAGLNNGIQGTGRTSPSSMDVATTEALKKSLDAPLSRAATVVTPGLPNDLSSDEKTPAASPEPKTGQKKTEATATPVVEQESKEKVDLAKLEKEATEGIVTGNNTTPLHYAAEHNHIKVAELLLDSGIDINITNIFGATPIYFACYAGRVEMVNLLLSRGADPAKENLAKWTPLSIAARQGHYDVVRLLLDKGMDYEIENEEGATPLYWAAYAGHIKILEHLLSLKANVNVTKKGGWTPLSAAAQQGHTEVVAMLLKTNISINAGNNDGGTALYWASYNGHDKVVKLLLDAGADVMISKNDGWLPLSAASLQGHVEVVKLLLRTRADIDKVNDAGSTAMYCASYNGHAEVVKLLLHVGANLDIETKKGWTPLSAAASQGHAEIVQLILEHNKALQGKR